MHHPARAEVLGKYTRMHTHTHTRIYIYREREREKERTRDELYKRWSGMSWVEERERERERGREKEREMNYARKKAMNLKIFRNMYTGKTVGQTGLSSPGTTTSFSEGKKQILNSNLVELFSGESLPHRGTILFFFFQLIQKSYVAILKLLPQWLNQLYMFHWFISYICL